MVICCRDRAELLEAALSSVQQALRPGDDLIVVDSASIGPDVGMVARAAGATVLRCDRPGLSRARNVGWRATHHAYVLFTDDDCRPAPDWVTAGVRALQDERVGAVWGRVDPDTTGGLQLSVHDESAPREMPLTGDISAVGHGANMAFRRELLEALGGFDPMLGAGGHFPAGEDKDAFWRAVRAGWQVRADDTMQVVHVHWRDDTEAVRVMFRYGVGAGAVASKRRRLAGQRRLAVDEMWRHGLLPAARAARRGQWVRTAGAAARTAGVAVGAARARRIDLHDDLLSDDVPRDRGVGHR